MCVCSVAQSCALFVTPRTVARQAPLSMGFSRQEYWGGLPRCPSGDLSDSGVEPLSSALAGRFFTTLTNFKVRSKNWVLTIILYKLPYSASIQIHSLKEHPTQAIQVELENVISVFSGHILLELLSSNVKNVHSTLGKPSFSA